MKIKASLLRYCELSWEMLTHFKAFMKWSTFCRFDIEQFSTPSLRIATATRGNGEPIVFAPIETCLLVSGYALNPTVTKDEARIAGDIIDAELARLGQQMGVTKMLVVLPKDCPESLLEEDGWEEIRTYTRKIPVSAAMGTAITTPSPAMYLN
jgi:hypothetical protein